MQTRLKRAVVVGLESLCGFLDGIPRYDWSDRRWYRAGCWGCYPFGFSQRAIELDERWGTDVWARASREGL